MHPNIRQDETITRLASGAMPEVDAMRTASTQLVPMKGSATGNLLSTKRAPLEGKAKGSPSRLQVVTTVLTSYVAIRAVMVPLVNDGHLGCTSLRDSSGR